MVGEVRNLRTVASQRFWSRTAVGAFGPDHVRRRKRVVIAEPGTDHRRTVHRFPCRRRFHGPPIDIDGAARLGVRHATADHPRELLPSTFAACSGRCDVPENLLYHNLARRERPSTPWSGTSGRAATGSGRKGSTVTVGGPSRRRPTTVRTVAARMRGPAGTTGPLRLLVCRRLPGAAPRAMPTQCPPIGTKIIIPVIQHGRRRSAG